MAAEMGMSRLVWAQYESGRMEFSVILIETIREVTGFDPYVMAYDLFLNTSKMPERHRKLHDELKAFWAEELELMRRVKQRLPSSW
jgi:transcriptional regulator with XRE-family HTH domain